jgi:hypothetical protein
MGESAARKYRKSETVGLMPYRTNGFHRVGVSPGLLVVAYVGSSIDAYTVDANGDPVITTRATFMTIANPEGVAQDPVSGDMLFGTFSGSGGITVVKGFNLPAPPPAQGRYVTGHSSDSERPRD